MILSSDENDGDVQVTIQTHVDTSEQQQYICESDSYAEEIEIMKFIDPPDYEEICFDIFYCVQPCCIL